MVKARHRPKKRAVRIARQEEPIPLIVMRAFLRPKRLRKRFEEWPCDNDYDAAEQLLMGWRTI
jgi:hypothetical protein